MQRTALSLAVPSMAKTDGQLMACRRRGGQGGGGAAPEDSEVEPQQQPAPGLPSEMVCLLPGRMGSESTHHSV